MNKSWLAHRCRSLIFKGNCKIGSRWWNMKNSISSQSQSIGRNFFVLFCSIEWNNDPAEGRHRWHVENSRSHFGICLLQLKHYSYFSSVSFFFHSLLRTSKRCRKKIVNWDRPGRIHFTFPFFFKKITIFFFALRRCRSRMVQPKKIWFYQSDLVLRARSVVHHQINAEIQ